MNPDSLKFSVSILAALLLTACGGGNDAGQTAGTTILGSAQGPTLNSAGLAPTPVYLADSKVHTMPPQAPAAGSDPVRLSRTPMTHAGQVKANVVLQVTGKPWTGGYNGNLILSNDTDADASNWSLSFDLPAGTTAVQGWGNYQLHQVGHNVTFSNAAWNGRIAKHASLNLGFGGAGQLTGEASACVLKFDGIEQPCKISVDDTPVTPVDPVDPVDPTDPTNPTTPSLADAVHADQSKRAFTGYYPSWSDNWFDTRTYDGKLKPVEQIYAESKFAQAPGFYSHIMVAFGQPNFSWAGLAADTWAGTGISFNGKPSDIRQAIAILHARQIKVVLAVGGATYNEWTALAAEAGKPDAPIKSALTQFMRDMDIDGLDVDYEIEGSHDQRVNEYAHAIQALREAADAAGANRLLTLAAWSTGADCTAATSGHAGCAGKLSYWGGSAGRERQAFARTVGNGAHQGKAVAQLLDMVNVMAYDARYEHYDPVTAYDGYRAILPAGTIVSLGLETAPEGWAGGLLVVDAADAQCTGSTILADQYGKPSPGSYSVERFASHVMNAGTHPRDGMMLWHMLKTPTGNCGTAALATPAAIGARLGTLFGLPADTKEYR